MPRPSGPPDVRIDAPVGGPAVALARSLGTTVQLLNKVRLHLPPSQRLICNDKRSHGLAAPGKGPGLDDLADNATAVIGSFARDPVTFVGLSLGGRIARTIAHPCLAKLRVTAKLHPGAAIEVTYGARHVAFVE